jgi:hypothetical protein
LIETTLWHPVAGSEALGTSPVPVRLLQREGGKDALDLTIKSFK